MTEVPVAEVNDLLRRAAFGDAGAMSLLAQIALHVDYASPETSIVLSEVFSRLAAYHGRADDAFRVAQILTAHAAVAKHKGNDALAIDNIAEAMMIFDDLSEAGDRDAARALDHLTGAAKQEGLCEAAIARAKALGRELSNG